MHVCVRAQVCVCVCARALTQVFDSFVFSYMPSVKGDGSVNSVPESASNGLVEQCVGFRV